MQIISKLADSSYGREELRIRVAPVSVPAGWPSPAQDYFIEDLDLNKHLIEDADATYVVRVSGHSMHQAGLFDGDEVIVDRSLKAKHGDIVIAIYGGELTMKRLHIEGGDVLLKSENPRFPDIRIPPAMELEIWGVVRYGIRHVYRK